MREGGGSLNSGFEEGELKPRFLGLREEGPGSQIFLSLREKGVVVSRVERRRGMDPGHLG